MKNLPGFTFVEMTIVLSVLATVMGLVALNLLQARQQTSITTSVAVLVSDLRAQQVKAITGETQNTGVADSYGVHFDQNDYVLFKGTSYATASATNQLVQLDSSLVFKTIGADMVFTKPSGQLSGTNSAVLYDNTAKIQKTINLNTLGVVTSVN
jgi:prepilin-type N-terminal cleavage/methylation domain-containing protein